MQGFRSKELGFGAVGMILVVVGIMVAGLIGWRVYDASKNKQSASNAPTNTTKYLDIKELGIKIKLSDDIKDAVYYYDNSNKYPLVRVSTQSLIDKSDGACDPKTSSPFGSIRKTQDKTQPDGSVLNPNGSTVFQFGSDYLVFATPNQPCSNDRAITDLETAQLASFKEALKTVQLDK